MAGAWKTSVSAAEYRQVSLACRSGARAVGFCEARTMDLNAAAERCAAVTLLGLGGLHVAWATGSSWPARDGAELADRMAGRAGGSVPSPAQCLVVATLLASASALVDGRPRGLPRLRRLGAAGVAVALGVRGACGAAGRTDLVSPGSTSPSFRRLDRRYYSPLSLALAAAAFSSARR
jgi:hypothetical protein